MRFPKGSEKTYDPQHEERNGKFQPVVAEAFIFDYFFRHGGATFLFAVKRDACVKAHTIYPAFYVAYLVLLGHSFPKINQRFLKQVRRFIAVF